MYDAPHTGMNEGLGPSLDQWCASHKMFACIFCVETQRSLVPYEDRGLVVRRQR